VAGVFHNLHVHSGADISYDNESLATFCRHNISYVPQRAAETLFPWMSLGQNLRLRLNARNAAKDAVESEVQLICTALGFASEETLYAHFGFSSDGAPKRPTQLSGGQQQTLAVLRALLPRPAVLVLDEPFAPIDMYKGAAFREAFLEYVERNKVTTVMVTHSVEEAVALTDRILVLIRGNEGGTIAKEYTVGKRRWGRNLEAVEAAALASQIRRENGIG
jgi:NitT/TauT family transport system ATP-binding protein